MTRSEPAKFAAALEDYYEQKYNGPQLREIIKRFEKSPKEYLLALYNAVVETHESKYGKLPDLATIRRVQQDMPEAYTYQPDVLAIEDQRPDDDRAAEFIGNIKARMSQSRDEPNHEERNRIRSKVMKGDATRAEAWWIHVIDDLGGEWKPMPEDFA